MTMYSKEEHTTETDEAAIAADAIHGLNDRHTGVNTPVTNNEKVTLDQDIVTLYLYLLASKYIPRRKYILRNHDQLNLIYV